MLASSTLTLSEECMDVATAAGFTSQELTSLRRALAKHNEQSITEALARLSGIPVRAAEDGVALLHSLTETQLLRLEWTLKTLRGWD